MINLLNNASKYTPEGGKIRLILAIDESRAIVQVKDNGVGIPPEMLTEVFDMFTQVNRTLDRAQGGLGIGLSLVRRLTELHGGTVGVESVVGEGSCFSVWLPLREVEQAVTTLATSVGGSARARPAYCTRRGRRLPHCDRPCRRLGGPRCRDRWGGWIH